MRMKQPKYTDLRYPNGYTPAAATDLEKTFRRIRAEQKAAAELEARNKAEAEQKTRPMRRKEIA